jgi:hypothetical protein
MSDMMFDNVISTCDDGEDSDPDDNIICHGKSINVRKKINGFVKILVHTPVYLSAMQCAYHFNVLLKSGALVHFPPPDHVLIAKPNLVDLIETNSGADRTGACIQAFLHPGAGRRGRDVLSHKLKQQRQRYV